MRQKDFNFINAEKVLFYREMKIEMKEYLETFDDECFELYPFPSKCCYEKNRLN